MGNREAGYEVRDEEEPEEERRIGERPARDPRLVRDVDARETGRCEQADDDEVEELAVPVREPLDQRTSPQTSSTAATASSASITSTRRTRAAGLIGSRRVMASASGEPGSTNTCST
ncbi:MAG: hypothetical protein QOE43_1626 [Gaiellaceae bacterium]|jgi:hypothetical protein|nr:hypothetical protein [Gaiellaceae bacterium]